MNVPSVAVTTFEPVSLSLPENMAQLLVAGLLKDGVVVQNGDKLEWVDCDESIVAKPVAVDPDAFVAEAIRSKLIHDWTHDCRLQNCFPITKVTDTQSRQ
jgi:hypothetical protein